jgi:hypothetical protein
MQFIKEIPMGRKRGLEAMLDTQCESSRAQPMPTVATRWRQRKNLKAALLDHKDTLATADLRDFDGHSLDRRWLPRSSH